MGELSQQTTYSDDPAQIANQWLSAGALWLHVVNLDGAFDETDTANQKALQKILKVAQGGDVEVRNRARELEGKLASLMKEFEYQMRENVRAVEDRVAQQKLSKEAERRIQRLRREFQESFNQTVVAHRTGADQGDANAQPHVLRHIAPGDRVLSSP